ncbi:MAG: hypothetical protein OEY75_12825, partial [Hylemonella sp.]|nr:hypothetical protein [Hylemonella sp.]
RDNEVEAARDNPLPSLRGTQRRGNPHASVIASEAWQSMVPGSSRSEIANGCTDKKSRAVRGFFFGGG